MITEPRVAVGDDLEEVIRPSITALSDVPSIAAYAISMNTGEALIAKQGGKIVDHNPLLDLLYVTFSATGSEDF